MSLQDPDIDEKFKLTKDIELLPEDDNMYNGRLYAKLKKIGHINSDGNVFIPKGSEVVSKGADHWFFPEFDEHCFYFRFEGDDEESCVIEPITESMNEESGLSVDYQISTVDKSFGTYDVQIIGGIYQVKASYPNKPSFYRVIEGESRKQLEERLINFFMELGYQVDSINWSDQENQDSSEALEIDEEVKAIVEADDQDSDALLIEKVLKEYESSLIDEIKRDVTTLKELAESHGYKAYSGSDYRDTALVMNVKGMPDLSSLKIDGARVDHAINVFADQMQDEFGEDFTIRGRMGGYWGLAKLEDHLVITDDGYSKLIEYVKELLTDPELGYIEGFEDPDSDKEQVIYDCVVSDCTMIANKLLDDISYLDIEPEFVHEMDQLKDCINAEEKAMQDKSYWEE